MLIATAGHVDHGKTTLIHALTGVDTDRLPEERARGISIDLGFAYWRPDEGATIGFVDVPGHEKFVRNMLAGVGGVGLALLVVAADDGIMPQTIEHVRILELLGIGSGIVALTKCDRVEPGRIAEVRRSVSELLEPGLLRGIEVIPVSATTGLGMDRLREALIAARDDRIAAASTDRGFRLAIDRAFTVSGAGTVVTGTVVAGAAKVGDELVVSPHGKATRVRGLQSGGASVDAIGAGQRCAVNLVGIEIKEISRGDWLVEPGLHAPTTRIEARVQLLESSRLTIQHGGGVHLHLGAADLVARVLIPRQRTIAAGGSEVVQLVLDAPTSAIAGDRFILRDQSGRELLGGGRVLDPLATDRRRTIAQRRAIAAALDLAEPSLVLAALADISGHEPDARRFAQCFDLRPESLRTILAQGDFVRFGEDDSILTTRTRFDRLANLLVTALEAFHRAKPDAGGMTRREARAALGEPVPMELFALLLRDLAAEKRVVSDGALVRLPGHSLSFTAPETELWRSTLAALEDRAPRAIAIADLSRELRASEASTRAMLYRRRINGDIWQVTDTKYMLREHVAALVATAAHLTIESEAGFTAGQFRDATGIGRNFIIQLLEFFDRIGVTRRFGEARKMRSDYEATVGMAEAYFAR
jgi:selenocysteine-specific elongation factor